MALARLDYFELAENKAAKEEMLRVGIEDVQGVLRGAPRAEQMNAEMLRVHHRALSNSLWFFHRLRTTGASISIDDRSIIRANIEKLRSEPVWNMAKFYTATIENLMYGYELSDQLKDAMEMAELNLSLLTETANDKRQDGDKREVAELLDQDQRDMYLRALMFAQDGQQKFRQAALAGRDESGYLV